MCWPTGGCKAAIHATRMLFQDESCEGVLLVDAANAFNSSLATVLAKTYRGHAALFVNGETVYSQKV